MGEETQSQFGALCWRMRRGRIEVLLVTSRDTGRWVIPKGWPVEGLDGAGSASREAWEEAGVRATESPVALGFYTYDKVLQRGGDSPSSVPCVVSVFAMAVTRQTKDFPEARQRRRRWFSQAKASRKVDEPELQALIAGFAPVTRPKPKGKATPPANPAT
jgi:8-oxo-dGTP pyrophosphatase MutT (NUDIX family)